MHHYHSKAYKVFSVFNIILMLLLCLLILYPIYYMVIVSLSDGAYVLSGKVSWLPRGTTLRAYRAILRNPLFINSYKNTFLITGAGTAINLFMTMLCAYPLSRRELPGRRMMMTFCTFTMFFTGGMIPNYLLVTSLGLGGTYWAVILPGAISVYNMIIMRTFFEDIPVSLTEAAYIDGASDMRVLFSIVLPLSKPIIMTMILFYAVGHWNGYFNAMLYLNDKKQYPIQLFVRSIVLAGETLEANMASNLDTSAEYGTTLLAEQSTKFAVVILAMLPILIIYPIISKYFKGGVMIGAVKG